MKKGPYLRISRFILVVGIILIFAAEQTRANVTGTSMGNFNPTPSGVDFLTVHSSETLEPGIFNFGLFGNYAVNTLPLFSAGEEVQSRTAINDSVTMTDFNIGIGIMKNLEIGFSYPRIVRQKSDSNAPRGQFGALGNTELRFLTKYKFFGDSRSGYAAVLSTNINRIRNNPFAGIGAKPTYNFELVGDWTVSAIALGTNIGYRWFQQGTPIPSVSVQPTDDQLIGSVAASYLVASLDSKLIAEIFGSRPVKSADSSAANRQASSMELIGGIKHDLTTYVALHVGAGTELISGQASPDWRAYAGINITGGPVFERKKRRAPLISAAATSAPDVSTSEDLGLAVVVGETVVSLGEIQFEYNSSVALIPGAEETLGKLVKYLLQPPTFKSLTIEGHTDSIGSQVFNTNLSLKRANFIRSILVEKHHLDASKVQVIGYGEDKPIADNGNYQGRQMNRRVEYRIDR
jgi:outer membrane protein OmpA-like peptidoglycan-associated protein